MVFPARYPEDFAIGSGRRQRMSIQLLRPDFGEPEQAGMLLLSGMPCHRKNTEIPVAQNAATGWQPSHDFLRQSLLAYGGSAIHRSPAGTYGQAANHIVSHHYTYHRPMRTAMLIAGRRPFFQEFFAVLPVEAK